MAAITELVYGDRQLALAGEEVIRPIPWGNNWNTMRVGIRCAFYGAHFGNMVTSFAASVVPHNLTLGVCSGPQGVFHDRPKDYIGVKLWANTMTITSSAPATHPPYYLASGSTQTNLRKTEAGLVVSSNVSGLQGYFSSAPHLIRNAIMATFVKGSPNCTISIHTPNSAATGQTNVTRPLFLSMMSATTPSTTYVGSGSANNLAYTGDLHFDYVAIGWSKYYPGIEISDIAVTRFF